MTTSGDTSGSAGERIGSVEREAAISALDAHREAGRLTSVEFEERQLSASSSQTWGELLPLFTDLPEPRPAKVTALAAYAPPGSPLRSPAGARDAASGAGAAAQRWAGSGLAMPERVRETIMSLTPFVALILFFTTHTWLWFLAIPIVGIVLYGGHGKPPRNRHR